MLDLLRQHLEQLNTTRLELESLLSDRKVELADIETVKSCLKDLKNTLDDVSGDFPGSPHCTAWWAVLDLNQ